MRYCAYVFRDVRSEDQKQQQFRAQYDFGFALFSKRFDSFKNKQDCFSILRKLTSKKDNLILKDKYKFFQPNHISNNKIFYSELIARIKKNFILNFKFLY